MKRFKYHLRTLWDIFKYANAELFITFCVSMISIFVILKIGNNIISTVLLIAALLFYLFLVLVAGMAFGIRAYKETHTNSYRRSPDSKDLLGYYEKREKEYHPVKGVLMGLLSGYVLYILMFIYIFLSGIAKDNLGAVAKALYGVYSAPILAFYPDSNIAFNLIGAGIVTIVTEIGYIIGAHKIKAEKDKIKQKHEDIHS